MVCNPDGKCDDDPVALVTDLPRCPIHNCKPESFVYTGPTIDQDHCFTNTTYRVYSCSPPIDKESNFGILYYFDLVNEGVAKCDKKHYAATERVAAISSGWYNKGRHCFENVTIRASNGRSVVATIVDECVSSSGCTEELFNYGPCSPKALSGTQAVWEALGQNISAGIIQITWNFTSSLSLKDDGKSSSSTTVVIVSSVAGACVLLITLGVLVVWFFKSRNGRNKLEKLRGRMQQKLMAQEFSYKTIYTATNGLQEKLGEGGYGVVFKGRLPDGTLVAVKQMNGSSKQGLKQFKAELKSIARIYHVNLVKLLGFCTQVPNHMLLLVYEFVSNGSLERWIFDDRFLTWTTRTSIALGIARGLEYLHDACHEKILHLDIKPQNVLLDEYMTAKISDFGFAKLTEKERSHTLTVMRGTRGYMAPEWLHFKVTDRTDVYSYGVLLLELVCSKKLMEFREQLNCVDGVFDVQEVVDKRLLQCEFFNLRECQRIISIGVLCIQDDPQSRPSMGLVVKLLEEHGL